MFLMDSLWVNERLTDLNVQISHEDQETTEGPLIVSSLDLDVMLT